MRLVCLSIFYFLFSSLTVLLFRAHEFQSIASIFIRLKHSVVKANNPMYEKTCTKGSKILNAPLGVTVIIILKK